MTERKLITRRQCREMGLNFSNTHFGRLAKQGLLTPQKAGRFRSARVHYWLDEVLAMLDKRK